jgi:NTP pyrophosphatase (non-canonical NTP hydrolase)
MKLNEFQEQAVSTGGLSYRERSVTAIMGCALAVAGEAGEVVDLVKKWAMQGKALDREKLVEEMGDAMWGIALLSKALGITLEEVARYNGQKLRTRYPEGPRAVPAPVIPEWAWSEDIHARPNPEEVEALEGGKAPDGQMANGDYIGRCNHLDPKYDYLCTRVPGHNGDHIAACDDGEIVARWPWGPDATLAAYATTFDLPPVDANGSPVVDEHWLCPICDLNPCKCEELGYFPGGF